MTFDPEQPRDDHGKWSSGGGVNESNVRRLLPPQLIRISSSREASFDQCKAASFRVAQSLASHGIQATVVQLAGLRGPQPHDIHPAWKSLAGNEIHYAVRAAGKLVDVAGRQFGKRFGAIVKSYDRARRQWKRVYTVQTFPRV